MTKIELLRRIKSIEDTLGLIYSRAELKEDCDYHHAEEEEYRPLGQLKVLWKEYEKRTEEKEKK